MRFSLARVWTWPVVVRVWAIWLAGPGVPLALGALPSLFGASPEMVQAGWIFGGITAVIGFGLAASSDWQYSGPAERRMRWELAFGPRDWWRHAEIANKVAVRSPQRAERMLRSGFAKGGMYGYPLLAFLLRKQGRDTEAERLRDQLIDGRPADELLRLAVVFDQRRGSNPADNAALLDAVVRQEPGRPEHRDFHAALLAEAGADDEALAEHHEAVRLRAEQGLAADAAVSWQIRTAQALSASGRLADAEAVLRTAAGDTRVLTPLALLMAEQGRAGEAETMLREHPQAQETSVRYALHHLLIRLDRRPEAQALRPPSGWPRGYGGSPTQAAWNRVPGVAAAMNNSTAGYDSFAAIWGAGLGGSDGGAGSGHSSGGYGGGYDGGAGSYGGDSGSAGSSGSAGYGGGGW